VPLSVLAASLAFGALAAVWSVVAPLGEAPDEPNHLGLVLHLADGHGYPDYDGLQTYQATLRLCSTYAAATRACPRPGEPVTATSVRRHPVEDAPDKGARPAWNDAGGAAHLGRANQMPQHPPLYYQAMAIVLRVERKVLGHPWSLDRELALLRLVNAALIMPLPALAWWAARRAGLDDPTAVTAAFATFLLPMLTHIGSTLNNDNLLTLCGAILVALLAGVMRGDRSARTAVGVGAVTGVALLTKASAIVFPPVIVVAYLIGRREQRPGPAGGVDADADADVDGEAGADGAAGTAAGPPAEPATWRAAAVPVAVAGAVTAAISAWWYVGVRVRTGTFAPTTEDARLSTALRPPGFEASPWEFLTTYARQIDQRFWGSFGWYSVRFSTGFTYALTIVLVAVVAVSLGRAARGAGPRRLVLVGLLLPMGALKLFVVQHAWTLYARSSKFQFIQGRYLFAGVVGLAVVVAAGATRLAGRRADLAPVAVGAVALLLQGWALHRCLVDWWGGPGVGPNGRRAAMTAWSGCPGEVVALVCVGLVAAVVATVLALVVDSRRPVGSDDA
jgi:small subunit ribosomal protein S36